MDVTPFVLETAYDVMRKPSGVEALVRSKAPMMQRMYGERFLVCAPQPPAGERPQGVFEDGRAQDPEWSGLISGFEREFGLPSGAVGFGTWLIPGSPRCVLLPTVLPGDGVLANLAQRARAMLAEVLKLDLEAELQCDRRREAFNFGVLHWCLLSYLMPNFVTPRQEPTCLVVQLHGWQATLGMLLFRHTGAYAVLEKNCYWNQDQIKFVYTASDTVLGRLYGSQDDGFLRFLESAPQEEEVAAKAREYNVAFEHAVERSAAATAHALTAVSRLVGRQCKALLGRQVDTVTWNGIDTDSQRALVDIHDLQSTHMSNKQRIYEFMQTFFNGIDVAHTQIFFTAQRSCDQAKEIQMFIDALAIVRDRLGAVDYVRACPELKDKRVVGLIIAPQQHDGVTQHVLESMNLSQEIRIATDAIRKQLELNLVDAICSPDNTDLMKLSLDKLLSKQSCEVLTRFQKQVRSKDPNAPLTTHRLRDPKSPVIERLKQNNLKNQQYSPVKVIYIPELLSKSSVFQLDYQDFMRGAHLGVFSSQYKAYGYASPECMSVGTPSIITNRCGFADFVQENERAFRTGQGNDFIKGMELAHRTSSLNLLAQEHVERQAAQAGNYWVESQLGVRVVDMVDQGYDAAVNQQAEAMLDYLKLSLYDRIALRNRMARSAIVVDWSVLAARYKEVYERVVCLK